MKLEGDTASRLFLRLLRRREIWLALLIAGAAAAFVPSPAKVPIAMVLGTVLVARAGRRRDALESRPAGEGHLGEPLEFSGFVRGVGPHPGGWQQARLSVRPGLFETRGYWTRRRWSEHVLAGAVMLENRTSTVADRQLKPGRMTVVRLGLADGSTLDIAFARSIERSVEVAVADALA